MIDIAVLRAMAAAGATVDVILAAIETAQQKETDQLTARRANDAERQRRRRARHVTSRESQTVTRTDCDKPAYIKEGSKKESKEVSMPQPKTAARMRKHPIPSNWSISEQGIAYAQSKGWADPKITAEAQRFKNHALGKGRQQVDWEAAWRLWVTSSYQQPEKGNGKDDKHSLMAAFDRLDQQLAATDDREAGQIDFLGIPGGPIRGP